MRSRTTGRLAVGMAAALLVSGCYGPFQLTKRLHSWNGSVGDKWENEIVFLIMVIIPVYDIAVLGDALVFNTIEFWTGDNPMAKDVPQTSTKRIARGDTEAIVTQVADASLRQVTIQPLHHGQASEALVIKDVDGMTVAMDASGQVRYRVQTLADGRMVVTDADGRQVADGSAQEMQRLAASLPR
ncbi:MAG: DUF3332 family protein [Candidatus Omnitrophica bacterium]|nr:DUF3332 family protein [Candidatus Omnitrophota bacterium]